MPNKNFDIMTNENYQLLQSTKTVQDFYEVLTSNPQKSGDLSFRFGKQRETSTFSELKGWKGGQLYYSGSYTIGDEGDGVTIRIESLTSNRLIVTNFGLHQFTENDLIQSMPAREFLESLLNEQLGVV
jgi:hypothetical protein